MVGGDPSNLSRWLPIADIGCSGLGSCVEDVSLVALYELGLWFLLSCSGMVLVGISLFQCCEKGAETHTVVRGEVFVRRVMVDLQ